MEHKLPLSNDLNIQVRPPLLLSLILRQELTTEAGTRIISPQILLCRLGRTPMLPRRTSSRQRVRQTRKTSRDQRSGTMKRLRPVRRLHPARRRTATQLTPLRSSALQSEARSVSVYSSGSSSVSCPWRSSCPRARSKRKKLLPEQQKTNPLAHGIGVFCSRVGQVARPPNKEDRWNKSRVSILAHRTVRLRLLAHP